jgi:ABC-type dipeptide/oligopeptide/nickel transport system permease subunit
VGATAFDEPGRPAASGLGLRTVRAAAWARSNVLVTAALLVWAIVILAALVPSLFGSGDPNAQDLVGRFAHPGAAHHLLGTDDLGEDVYARLVYGARVSVAVGVGAVAIGAAIGIAMGVIGGYFRRANWIVSALVDIKMAFPGLLLALSIVIMLGHSNIPILILILGLTGWTAYARVIRSVVLSLRGREFIVAARAGGSGHMRIVFGHILPNIAGPASVLAVLDLSRVILAEAALSFLGLGIQPPSVSWGLMLGSSEDYIYNAWWLVTFPGIAIGLLVLATNIIANRLQVKMDPTQRTSRVG